MSGGRQRITGLWTGLASSSAVNLLATFLAALLVTAIDITVYATTRGGAGQTMALAGMIAASAVVSGGVIGFLFALPRSVTVVIPSGRAGSHKQLTDITVRPNTNLEEVSDWVVKIIVGLTLTQLGKVPRVASGLFDLLGRSLGGSPQDVIFTGSLIVFCSIVGFLMGWLSTRMFIGRWMAVSDRPLEAAEAAAAQRHDGQMQEAIAHARAGMSGPESQPASRGDPGTVSIPESRQSV
ncbi:MAG TPA: hypothetical protein VMH35_18515 [Streptosporangiaceae bacterium]|nr:hypothetical protein [Streptosporangiaceae bacterium]